MEFCPFEMQFWSKTHLHVAQMFGDVIRTAGHVDSEQKKSEKSNQIREKKIFKIFI